MSIWKPGLVKLVAIVGGMALFNYAVRKNVGIPSSRTGGDAFYFPWQRHHIYYEVAGPEDAPPLLLIHGHNAGASSYEMRHVFRKLRDAFRVYAVDLLGYGMSDRPALRYTADLYADLIADFVRDVIQPEHGPTHLLASSLSSAHALLAAHRHPELFRKLLLICPTGIASLTDARSPLGEGLFWLMRIPVLGTFLFNLLVSRPSLRYFLQQSYANADNVTEQMIDDYYEVTHQPGAQYAPVSFISGQLNCDIREEWQSLQVPAFIVWGQQANYTPVTQLQQFLALRPDTPHHIFADSGILPHDEQADEFCDLARRWFLD